MLDSIQIGLYIQENRNKLNLTQKELSDKLFVSRQALSKWERGESLPTIELLVELSKIFNITMDDLLLLNNKIEVDSSNPFKDHSRDFIIRSIINKTVSIDLIKAFKHFTPPERMIILRAIKENKITTDIISLKKILTPSELKFIGGNLPC